MADAQDLKSCVPYRTYRFDPGLRHQSLDRPVRITTLYRRGVEQLVARRAHNPEVRGSSPLPATMKQTLNLWNYKGSAIFIALHNTVNCEDDE